MARVLVVALFAVMALQNLGVELLPLIAGLGVAGAGIALAMQGVLGNIVAGFTIIFTKPFRVGEYISIVGVEGQVESIELFSTRLSHADRSIVVVPNRKIVGEIMHNYGQIRQSPIRGWRLRVGPCGRPQRHQRYGTRESARAQGAGAGHQVDVADSAVQIAVKPWVAVKTAAVRRTQFVADQGAAAARHRHSLSTARKLRSSAATAHEGFRPRGVLLEMGVRPSNAHRLGRRNMTLAELLALASPGSRGLRWTFSLGYTETFGAPALRAEIARTYDTVTPEHLLCFAGAEEGVYVAMQVLLRPDDHAIVITPNYQAAETVPLSICEVTGVPLDIDRGRDSDLDLLRAALRPNTRPHLHQLPEQSHRENPLPSGVRCTGRDLPPPRDLAVQRRGLPADRARSGAAAAASGGRLRARRLAQRHVQGLRAGRPANRLAGVQGSADAGEIRALQAFPVHLQLGAFGSAGADRAQGT